MCSDPFVHMQQLVSCTAQTWLGFEATADRVELIVGRGGIDDARAGSSLRLVLFDSPQLLPRLVGLLERAAVSVEAIQQNKVPGQVVRWPPRPGQPPR